MVSARALLAVAAALGCACAGPRVTVGYAGPERVAFRVALPADEVALRGTMTGWSAVPLERRGEEFLLVLSLPSGRYEYRLELRRGEVVEQVLADGAERADDGFGGENGVIRVP